MKNNQFIMYPLLLLLVWYSSAVPIDDGVGIYCLRDVSGKTIDACHVIDLNGDGFQDILISSGVPNGFAYAELINLKGNGFCVKRDRSASSSGFIRGIPAC